MTSDTTSIPTAAVHVPAIDPEYIRIDFPAYPAPTASTSVTRNKHDERKVTSNLWSSTFDSDPEAQISTDSSSSIISPTPTLVNHGPGQRQSSTQTRRPISDAAGSPLFLGRHKQARGDLGHLRCVRRERSMKKQSEFEAERERRLLEEGRIYALLGLPRAEMAAARHPERNRHLNGKSRSSALCLAFVALATICVSCSILSIFLYALIMRKAASRSLVSVAAYADYLFRRGARRTLVRPILTTGRFGVNVGDPELRPNVNSCLISPYGLCTSALTYVPSVSFYD